MSPAFSSTNQAGSFALLLLGLLLSPIIVPKSVLPPREQIYTSLPWSVGPYPFIHQQVYEEKSDVDIAIIGSSRVWCALDAPYLQEKFGEKIGRTAVVISLACPWDGFDNAYFIARDLLEHRKVHMLVFSDASGVSAPQEFPHKQAWRWFRFGEDADSLAGLPLRVKLTYYYGSILGLPRNLLGLIRANLAPDLSPGKVSEVEKAQNWTLPEKTQGSLAVQVGYDNRPDLFVPFRPDTATQPSDVSVYSPETSAQFRFQDAATPSLQIHFARMLGELAHAHGTQLTCINLPTLMDIRSPIIRERYFWPDAMQTKVAMLGVAPSILFEGMSNQDILKLFWDPYHFNQNGQAFFTRLVAPSLFDIYDDPANH